MSKLQFETPENVAIEYSPAGLGTRYVAWLADQVIFTVLVISILFIMACAGASFAGVERLLDDLNEEESTEAAMYIVGLVTLIMGLGSFVYFGLSELLMRGQTPGKRLLRIRVAKVDGFSLDATGILVRNAFRVVDHIPLLWVVPLLSARSQRAGDMVAGTVVISDEKPQLSAVRVELAERSVLESEFRFDGSSLNKLTDTDLHTVEQMLERWTDIPQPQRNDLVERIVTSLTTKLNLEMPEKRDRLRFLEDILAAELRRQQQGLG